VSQRSSAVMRYHSAHSSSHTSSIATMAGMVARAGGSPDFAPAPN
jgi:hypothetical protein